MKEAKLAKAPVLSERQLMIRAIGQTLWNIDISKEQKMSAEQRQASWQENRDAYIQISRTLVRRMERRGYKLSKGG